MDGYRWTSKEALTLESGGMLPECTIFYHTYGRLNTEGSNVVWVTHALTGSSDAADWWGGLIGAGKCFDPEQYFIVCANNLGSCYGSTGPLAFNPEKGEPYYSDFPLVTVRDQVRAHQLLAAHLGIDRIFMGIGGSMGGQQMIQWAVDEPDRFVHLVLLATNAFHSPWGIAFNETQRMALKADPGFLNPHFPDAGRAGLEAARAIGMLSYRNYQTYALTQTEEDLEVKDDFRASSYQRYQGLKLWERFNPWSYHALSRTMDSHQVGRGYVCPEEALSRVRSHTFVIGIRSDILFPIAEQQFLARHIPGASFFGIDSVYGHDGFLVEWEQMTILLEAFLSGKPHATPLPVYSPTFFRTALPGSERF